MICPKCKQDRAHRTERAGAIDRSFNWFFLKPYLCHNCSCRFHAFPGDGSALRMELDDRIQQFTMRPAWKRNIRELTFYSCAGLVIASLIYYMWFTSGTRR